MSVVLPENQNQFWEQFNLTNFPNGISLDGCPLLAWQYTLSSAELKALQTTAVLVVPPPITAGGILIPTGGFAFYPVDLSAEYAFVTTAYTIANADNAIQIEYVGKATALLSLLVTGLVDQAASTLAVNNRTSPGAKISRTNAANLGLEVKLIGTTPALTLGDGLLHLKGFYRIIPLAA